jgi:hypothetical protein
MTKQSISKFKITNSFKLNLDMQTCYMCVNSPVSSEHVLPASFLSIGFKESNHLVNHIIEAGMQPGPMVSGTRPKTKPHCISTAVHP